VGTPRGPRVLSITMHGIGGWEVRGECTKGETLGVGHRVPTSEDEEGEVQ
jgi:hypothetical protein